MSEQELAELFENEDFLEFVLREAEATMVHATAEDLAIFGFGSVDDAVEAFLSLKATDNKA